MKKILALVLVLGFMGAQAARADFSGEWAGKGSGQWDGQAMVCPTMGLSLFHSAQEFLIIGGRFDCVDVGLEFGRISMEIRGEEVWYEGEKIGTATADSFEVAQLTDDGRILVKIALRRTSPTTIAYEEIWEEEELGETFRLTGELTLASK